MITDQILIKSLKNLIFGCVAPGHWNSRKIEIIVLFWQISLFWPQRIPIMLQLKKKCSILFQHWFWNVHCKIRCITKATRIPLGTVLCSTVQGNGVQCILVLYSAVQCSAKEFSTVYLVLYSAVQCSGVQCILVLYSAVQCSGVQCILILYSAVLCSVIMGVLELHYMGSSTNRFQ